MTESRSGFGPRIGVTSFPVAGEGFRGALLRAARAGRLCKSGRGTGGGGKAQ